MAAFERRRVERHAETGTLGKWQDAIFDYEWS